MKIVCTNGNVIVARFTESVCVGFALRSFGNRVIAF